MGKMNHFGTSIFGLCLALLIVATIFVALRLVSRIFVARRITLSDYVMCLAWAIVTALSATIFSSTAHGLGMNEGVPLEWRQQLVKLEYIFAVLYNPALMAIKSSILIFYLTLSKGQGFYRLGTYITLALVNITGLILTVVNVIQCHPLSAAFKYYIPPDAKCINIIAIYLSSSPVNVVTDIAIFFLPIPTLWRMRLPKKQKIILLLTFGTGLFVTVISIIRTVYIVHSFVARIPRYYTSIHPGVQPPTPHDASYFDAYLFLWSAIEIDLGIICGCVPSLKPLVARILPRLIENPGGMNLSSDRGPITSDLGQPSPIMSQADTSAVQARINNAHDITHTTTNSVVVSEYLRTSPAAAPGNQQSSTDETDSGTAERAPFFDFVTFRHTKSILKMNNQESLVPIGVMSIIFFLGGFVYGFLGVLNTQFFLAGGFDHLTPLEFHAAYFGAFTFGPILVARQILKRKGFKATLITGLSIYTCGTLMFWPVTVLLSLPAFMVSNFIVGLGLSVVETAADLFIVLCGPMERAEMRLNFVQGIQAAGRILSSTLAQQILFKDVKDEAALTNMEWTYLGITLLVILVAVVYSFLQLPEVSNEEFKQLADQRRNDFHATMCGIRVVWATLALGAISQFCNIGGRENLQTQFPTLVTYNESNPVLPAVSYLTIGRSIFAIGHFLAALAQLFLKPRWILLGLYLGVILFSILSMNMTGYTGITMGLLVFLFNAGIFSITFAICLRGMVEHTKTGASIIATAISGGALFPFIQNIVATSHTPRYAFCVNVTLFSFGAIFPLYLNLVPAARKQVDPIRNEYLGHFSAESCQDGVTQ